MSGKGADASARAALGLALLGCPACAAKLSPLGEGDLSCTGCSAEYPVVAGVPILVVDPVGYMAEHRTSLLAALAELTDCSPVDVATVERWARRRPVTTQRFFDDDFTRDEEHAVTTPLATEDAHFAAFVASAAATTPLDRLLELHGRPLGRTVEVGCGAGNASAALAESSDGLVMVDRSFRAVLIARERAEASPRPVVAAVMDAEQLALREGACETLVALHLVDVLADPLAFLEGALASLARRGTLLLSTPDPALGMPDGPADVLAQVAADAGFEVTGRADFVPWLRVHSPRELQVFFVQLLALVRPR